MPVNFNTFGDAVGLSFGVSSDAAVDAVGSQSAQYLALHTRHFSMDVPVVSLHRHVLHVVK